jgi:DNA-binding NarL/FixJ family response regulator
MKLIKNIYILDDHSMIVEGIKSTLAPYSDINIIGGSSDPEEFLARFQTISDQIDILILDIEMPKIDGLSIIESIIKKETGTKIIVYSMHNKRNYIEKSFELGAMGYVLKSNSQDEIYNAINYVSSGMKYTSPQTATILFEKKIFNTDLLTARELEIAKKIAQGLKNSDIAEVLFISPRTVETHRLNIFHKLNIKNTSEFILYAHSNGWIE